MPEADAETPHDHTSSTAPPVPVDNSHEAMERRGELHATLFALVDRCISKPEALLLLADAMIVADKHGVHETASMLTVLAEDWAGATATVADRLLALHKASERVAAGIAALLEEEKEALLPLAWAPLDAASEPAAVVARQLKSSIGWLAPGDEQS